MSKRALPSLEGRYPWAQPRGRVLFVGTCYYNTWYLSRALRARGWVADTFSDAGDGAEAYMHGTDYRLDPSNVLSVSYPSEYLRFVQEATADFLRRVRFLEPRKGTPPPAGLPSRRGHRPLTSLAPRVGAGQRFPHPLSFIELTTRLLGETESERLLALLDEFLWRIRPHPDAACLPLYDLARRYDILHFCGMQNLRFFYFLAPSLVGCMPIGWDIEVLRRLGKKIVYSNTGCMDGVAQSSFHQWGPYPICDICRWRDVPAVCSDERNLSWGALRNYLSDYQILLGGNHVDYNDDPRVHEVPEFYCLDPDFWRPDLPIPEEHRLPHGADVVKIYHAVGNYEERTRQNKENIKTTHLIVPTVQRLKADGYPVELVFCTNKSNQEVRYYQAQADIVVDMLTYGFFGANIREAMMLGKPAVCFLRPEWLDSMRTEIPGYVDELPVVSANPDTVYGVLADLVKHPAKRAELGRRGRAFALKWHSSTAGARRFEQIYSALLQGRTERRCA
jgi:hypothetical protein